MQFWADDQTHVTSEKWGPPLFLCLGVQRSLPLTNSRMMSKSPSKFHHLLTRLTKGKEQLLVHDDPDNHSFICLHHMILFNPIKHLMVHACDVLSMHLRCLLLCKWECGVCWMALFSWVIFTCFIRGLVVHHWHKLAFSSKILLPINDDR